MNKECKKIDMKVNRKIADRINQLMSIDDFDENPELLEKLGFEVDGIAFRQSVVVDDITIELSVYTGQTNAWIEVVAIDANNNVGEGDPIFDVIEGEYYVDTDSQESYILNVLIED